MLHSTAESLSLLSQDKRSLHFPFHLRLEVLALFLLLHEENIPPRETVPYLRGLLSPSQPLLKSSTSRESLCPLHFQYCSYSDSSVTSRGPVAMEAVRSDCGFSHYLPQGGGRARSLHYTVFLIPQITFLYLLATHLSHL